MKKDRCLGYIIMYANTNYVNNHIQQIKNIKMRNNKNLIKVHKDGLFEQGNLEAMAQIVRSGSVKEAGKKSKISK